ncbi:hypothetical protein PGT21_033427 [Puccinia graminis f. sp. tritici]|uniref:Secreted protein n=1 Tax=Puccinia graminis f. sp. tritici TaxID=56615 RepID=A0A5B0MNB4_PUCGR|nr:hypothetical protein PGT21_032260 [Puccinia graminis f. sp. tritici]KAA1078321.1 hypothetical protein PGT21_033427 [Puccinia graminis f. sp. tritici]KAA1086343.1 hypothetical protein PGTUg99_014877 [Puccinia graminis f. sp. tritici]KAA1106746.1 hypothetical protein PGTUg99_018917 [Puccinia graminis f. sp. tritici]
MRSSMLIVRLLRHSTAQACFICAGTASSADCRYSQSRATTPIQTARRPRHCAKKG